MRATRRQFLGASGALALSMAAGKPGRASPAPLNLPQGPYAGFGRIGTQRAAAAGLKIRPVEDTARATLAWFDSQPAERRESLKAGLARAREEEVLAALKSR